MTRRLVLAYVTLTALALALLATPLGITFAHREHDRLLFDAVRGADTIATMVDDPLESHTALPTDALIAAAHRLGVVVVVVDDRATILLDSAHPDRIGTSLATGGDIRTALKGKRTTGRAELEPGDAKVSYATVPSTGAGVVDGAIRITYPTTTLDDRVRDVWQQIVLLCLAVLVAVVIVGALIARGVTRPLRRLERATDQLGRGELTIRLDESQGPAELRRVASTFNRMAAQLSDLIASQTQFVGNASHQLRSPLTALRLRLENLEAEAEADESDRVAIQAASDEVVRMSRLVDGLLLLANDVAHRDQAEPVDVAAIARDRVGGWVDVARDQGVEMILDAPPTAFAQTLPSAPEQILDNLIDNALNAAPRDTTITVAVTRHNSTVEISVLDQGPGLDASARSRAFDRFWRAPNAYAGGTGLGLAIVRQLVEASGGAVRLDARPGGGLAAEVTLRSAQAPG